jgi:hypothetical protein
MGGGGHSVPLAGLPYTCVRPPLSTLVTVRRATDAPPSLTYLPFAAYPTCYSFRAAQSHLPGGPGVSRL